MLPTESAAPMSKSGQRLGSASNSSLSEILYSAPLLAACTPIGSTLVGSKDISRASMSGAAVVRAGNV